MPSPNATPTPITPPRVPLIDQRTGLIDRAWYMFFLSLMKAATAVVDDGVGSSYESLIASYDETLRSVNQELQTLPPAIDYSQDIINLRKEKDLNPSSEIGELQAQINDVRQEVEAGTDCSALISQLAEVQKQLEALQMAPQIDAGAILAAISSLAVAPVTYTANFTVPSTGTWSINNKSGSTCTVTLPSATTSTGRVLQFQNYQAQTLVSAASNVVPLVGGAAGTAILAAVAGDTATLVSDGSNWIMTQYVPNNILLLE
jgi:hypothetical protein